MAAAIIKQYPVLPREHRFGFGYFILSVINLAALAAIGLYYRSLRADHAASKTDALFWIVLSVIGLCLLLSFSVFLHRYALTNAKVAVTEKGLVRRTLFHREETIAWESIHSAFVCQLFSLRPQPQTPPVIAFFRSAGIAEKARETEKKYGVPFGSFPSFLLSHRKEIVTFVYGEEAKERVQAYCPRLFEWKPEQIPHREDPVDP